MGHVGRPWGPWHEREIGRHLAEVSAVAEAAGEPGVRLAAVLERYALNAHAGRRGHDAELAVVLHRNEQVAAARHSLRHLVAGLIREAAAVARCATTSLPTSWLRPPPLP